MVYGTLEYGAEGDLVRLVHGKRPLNRQIQLKKKEETKWREKPLYRDSN